MPHEPPTAPPLEGPSQAAGPTVAPGDGGGLVTLDVPDAMPLAPGRPGPRPASPGVHVPPDILQQVLTPEREGAEKRDLDAVVHQVLIVGLALSTMLMLAGVGLELARGTALPAGVAELGQVFPRVLALRPSGFLTLGLLVLIATPILRVLGSIAAFVYERDWRFVGVTALVLLVMIVSIVLGKG